MKLKNLKITHETDSHTFFNITIIRDSFWMSRRTKEKRKCFHDKSNGINRFIDSGEIIENSINHSINALLLCHQSK